MQILLEKNERYIYAKFSKKLKTVSSSFYNGGYGESEGFFILNVDENFDQDPEKIARDFEESKNIHGFVGFLTAVDLKKMHFFTKMKIFLSPLHLA